MFSSLHRRILVHGFGKARSEAEGPRLEARRTDSMVRFLGPKG